MTFPPFLSRFDIASYYTGVALEFCKAVLVVGKRATHAAHATLGVETAPLIII